jgi:subtilase family serine protease
VKRPQTTVQPIIPTLIALLLLLSACSSSGANLQSIPTPTLRPTQQHTPISMTADVCPTAISNPNCITPYALRLAYGVQSLTDEGYTGKGQTIIDIVSYGSPTLQRDMDIFDQQFHLPAITIQVIAPLGTAPKDPTNKDIPGWAVETELDVEVMHAIAPDAHIIVMPSPVDETEGTIGLPEFLQLEQYAVAHHLGQIFSQSYVASEATLADSAGQQLVQQYTNFYKQITIQQGYTIVNGSGDHGATDWANIAMTQLSSTAIVNFPADVPWVTAVGGTSLLHSNGTFTENAWSGSGGGISTFFAEPDFQKSLPASIQSLLNGQRGIPDIAGDANPGTAMVDYIGGQWTEVGGTSASTPLMAGIIAIANQMAGHPLGFINPGIYKLAASQNTPQAFSDIINGSNAVDKGNIHVAGFTAQPGWDAVTGWGSPQASQFIPALIAALK